MQLNRNGAVAQLGEHLLCKQGVTGSIPVSSTKSHSLFPVRRHKKAAKLSSVTATWKQAARRKQSWAAGFQEPQGSALPAKGRALMFDNEIDWVT